MHVADLLRTEPAGSSEEQDRHLRVLGVAILVALGLRLARLTFQPLWWDEGWSLYFATTDVRAMLELTAVDIHPPLYYLLLHLWIRLFGPGVFSVRLLSVLIGTATVPLLYAAGRRLWGRKVGLLAALLLAISPFHIFYSQEVRMYGLVTLLGLAAFYFALQGNPGTGEWRTGPWFGYVLSAAAALYTQYYAAFLLLGLNLAVLVCWLRRRHPAIGIVRWLGAQAAVVLLFVPWLWYASGRLLSYVRFKVSVEKDPAQDLFTYIGRHLAAFNWGHAEGLLADWWWLGLLPLVILLPFLARAFMHCSPSRQRIGCSFSIRTSPFIMLAVALLCGFAVNLIFPFHPPRSERLLLLALPAYLLLFGGGLVFLLAERPSSSILPMASLVVVGLVSLGFFYTVPRYPGDDYRPVADRIRALGLPIDAAVAVHPWQVGYLQSYIPDSDARPTLYLTPREVLPREQQLWAEDSALMAADLEGLLAHHQRLWFLDHQAMGRVLENQIETYLTEHAYPTLHEWYGENTVLSLFVDGEAVSQPVSAEFGDWLNLENAALSPGPLEAGWGVVAVDLTWRLAERPDGPYQVGLRLADGAGHVWAQRDSLPGGGLEQFATWSLGESHLDRHGLLVPAGTPPGDYHVTLRVYQSQDLSVLPAVFQGGSGGEVVLGPVRVNRPAIHPLVEALDVQQELQVEFGPLQLLGFTENSPPILLPGEAVEVDLFWQALADPGEDLLPRLQLLDSGGASLTGVTDKPVAGTYPTAWWQAGELVRDPQALPIPATVPMGRYRLALSLVRAADGTPVEVGRGQASVDLTEIEIHGREHRFEPTTPARTQQASLGPAIELLGYDLREVVRSPGAPLEVALHWHALETPDRNYHSFVHLLDAEGRTVAQHDSSPASEGGELPTLGWLPGEYVVDIHRLQLPFDLPDGDYYLDVGLYDPNTGQRPGEPVPLDTTIPVSASKGCQCP
jgi:4-amino-4-deoxy-L-arabinose transferase-like glycosyltransferase